MDKETKNRLQIRSKTLSIEYNKLNRADSGSNSIFTGFPAIACAYVRLIAATYMIQFRNKGENKNEIHINTVLMSAKKKPAPSIVQQTKKENSMLTSFSFFFFFFHSLRGTMREEGNGKPYLFLIFHQDHRTIPLEL